MIIFLGTVFIVGIFFVYKAFQKKASNFYYIGATWLLFGLGQVMNQVLMFPVEIYTIFTKFGFFLAVPFTNITFYKERRSFLPKLIFIFSIGLTIITWYFDSIRYNSEMFYYLSRSFDFVHFSIIANWLAISCYLAYKHIKNLKIAPWIKVRYRLVYISSPLFSLVYLLLIFYPFELKFGDISTPQSFLIYSITSIIILAYGLLFTSAWLMPKKLKDYFNRKENYMATEDKEYTELELIELIKKELDRGGYA
jgi:hypothetical protein